MVRVCHAVFLHVVDMHRSLPTVVNILVQNHVGVLAVVVALVAEVLVVVIVVMPVVVPVLIQQHHHMAVVGAQNVQVPVLVHVKTVVGLDVVEAVTIIVVVRVLGHVFRVPEHVMAIVPIHVMAVMPHVLVHVKQRAQVSAINNVVPIVLCHATIIVILVVIVTAVVTAEIIVIPCVIRHVKRHAITDVALDAM